jgi:hypothetical protein
MKVVLDQSLIEKLDKIKALLSHKKPHMTDRELLEEMANLTLSRLDPAQKTFRRERTPKTINSERPKKIIKSESKTKSALPRPAPVAASRYISKRVKQLVWIRDGGKCTHPGCSATHFLEYDHIVPYSLGGKSNVENIRLLCRAHNQRAAIDHFGIQKMGPHFRILF